MKFIQQFDQYAPKVELNLKGKTYQQTTFGGFVSLILYIGVFAYGVTLVQRLVQRSDPQISTYELVSDLSKVGQVTADEINFGLAIQFWSFGEQERNIPLEEIETYFTIEINITTQTNFNKSPIMRKPLENPLVSCYQEVNGKRPFQFVEKQVLDQFLVGATCVNTAGISFNQDPSFPNTTYLQVGVSSCKPESLKTNNKTCKSKQQVDQYVKSINPKFLIITGKDYIDSNDFDRPIKTLVERENISPIELYSIENYKATLSSIQIVDFTLLDRPFQPFTRA